MPVRAANARSVVVVGGGLAGLAAAARLAKAGHRLTLLEAAPQLGEPWLTRPDGTDVAPSQLAFPAPWRDLFRKSGRPLEEECRRSALELVAAPPTRHSFADGSELELPTGRAEQHEAIVRRCGVRAANAWQSLIDSLADLWQQLRFLGLEKELDDASALDRRTRRALWADRSLADLAAGLPDPRLGALVSDLGYRQGSVPDRTPAFCAVSLFVDRSFGRWMLRPPGASDVPPAPLPPTLPVSLSRLTRLLIERVELRRVVVRLGTEIEEIEADERVRAVRLSGGEVVAADAVVVCTDPWRLYRDWLPEVRGSHAFRVERRGIRRLQPALAARSSAAVEAAEPKSAAERWIHQPQGPPVIESWHRDGAQPVRVSTDFRAADPDPTAGARWHGFASWLDRPPVTSALTGLFVAGGWSRAGDGPDREVLSAALAAASAQRLLERAP